MLELKLQNEFSKRREYNKNIQAKARLLVNKAKQINSVAPVVGLVQFGFDSYDAIHILNGDIFHNRLDIQINQVVKL